MNASPGNLFYQWYAGNAILPGETNSTLTVANLSEASAGVYRVIVSDRCGDSVTNCAVLALAPLPRISCSANRTLQLGTSWDFDAPSANYPVTIIGTTTNSSGFCGSTFDATRVWQASDTCGNSVTCSQTVTVIDTTPPVIDCTSSSNKTVQLGMPWTFDPPTATDNSGSVTITILST